MCMENLGINDFVEAANKNDRLNLLNDPSVLEGNLDNPIHPIFHDSCFLEKSLHLKQALQLASLFLTCDSLLEFFIPLTYGRLRTDTASGRVYLSNPAASKSGEDLKPYLNGVRQALHCLEHCVVIRWVNSSANSAAKRLWARTRPFFGRRPSHAPDCSKAFIYESCVLIEINEKLRSFYDDEESGYRTRSHCDQFRHDFQTATTIVHEIVHAFGIMRRGNLGEPWIRLDHAENEWGYAWENFVFGAIVNPQERERPGTHVQLRKTWSTLPVAIRHGGKEYSAVGVSWVAQWFRKETWDQIERYGPLAITPSIVRIKFISSSTYRRWIVMTDVTETQTDIERLHDEAEVVCANDNARCKPSTIRDFEVGRVLWTLVDSVFLQQSNVPIPTRVPPKLTSHAVAGSTAKRMSVGGYPWSDIDSTPCSGTRSPSSGGNTPCSSGHANKRLRDDEPSGSSRPRKVVKRSSSR